MASPKRTTLAALALTLSLATSTHAQEAVAWNFGASFRWCNGPVIDRVVTSAQLAALGLPIPLAIIGAGMAWTPVPGPWPGPNGPVTGDGLMAVDVGTAYYNSAKLYPPGLQNGPLGRLNLLTIMNISPGQPMTDVHEFAYPIMLRAGDALLFSYNCTGDPFNYTIGANFAFAIKYRVP